MTNNGCDVLKHALRCSFADCGFGQWKRVAKPIALLLGLFAAPTAFFHYIMEGPKEPQPQPPGQEVPR